MGIATIVAAGDAGVYAFWAERVNGKGAGAWPWDEPGGLGHTDDGTEPGCVLVHRPYTGLYYSASIVPCDAPAATGIVCVPGSGFGQKENTAHLRFVILPPPAIIDTAMERLADFMNARR